ncbi:TlpA disulfide reductase family protein [Sedimenticola selenatireducens]|jgi:thiol-disulfide isomerase/thioredoxin|uniref:TlpA family protein disulfide reductase n=1 Tax=Sedimenticola selenatireducens TaxID=191960 RepID=A0A558E0L8_9GAMM|nr:TlpA disulfide reductase family protein [Sedimenticola selenatireducens]TVO75245.1 TlpA family protein disulfide reductase [Sedimenticola selenatireducens]TVT66902.1 MAG: TlpA family protein disulfide reductase [Sedimenticola selenatireducens]
MQILKLLLLGLLLSLFSPAQGADLILPDLTGKDRALSEFRGKWVLINFWATWCPPCIEEMPELERFHAAHKDKDAMVVGVNMEDIELAELKEFVESMFISYPVLLAPSDGTTVLGRISALPTSLLISPQGELIERRIGSVTEEMIEQMIERHSNDLKQVKNSNN